MRDGNGAFKTVVADSESRISESTPADPLIEKAMTSRCVGST